MALTGISISNMTRAQLYEARESMRTRSSHYDFPVLRQVIDEVIAQCIPDLTVPGTAVEVPFNTQTAVAGISVEDKDEAGNLTLTFVASQGIVTVKNNVASGVTAGEITTNGTATVVVTSTKAKLNITLADVIGVQYTPATGASGSKTIAVTLADTDAVTANDTGTITLTVAAS